MIRMAGSKLLARLLLLISSITLVSLLALTRCGIGGLVDSNILITDDDGRVMQQTHADALNRDQQNNYMILLQQREEENRQEIAKLTAEIKALKVQLLQHRRPSTNIVILETEKKDPIASSSKEDRYSFNYWGDSVAETIEKKETEYVKIENLAIGKLEQQSLVIRITYKNEVKETKFGKVVSFLGMDETGEIAIVSFGKCGLQLHKDWKINEVYVIENFTVQEENVNYPSGSNNTLQIKTNQNFCYNRIDDKNILSPIPFQFKSIEEIKSINRNSRIDLIGILIKDYGLETNANNVSLRDLAITDEKKGNIIVTLWGSAAENFKSTEKCAIVIRKGVVGEFQEKKKINCTVGTLAWLNPQIPETSPILKWFQESNV